MTDYRYREIPYNYTSFSDKEIILKYFDPETWTIFDNLREKRVTGRSARLFFDVIGQIFLIDRNPYIFNDFLESSRKLRSLKKNLHRKITEIENLAEGNPQTNFLIKKFRDRITLFISVFPAEKKKRAKALSSLKAHTREKNIFFSAFHKIAHATDATDWRVENPFCVVYPDAIKEIPGLIKAARKTGLSIIPRGAGTGLTGGVVPVRRDTLIINTEKLKRIYGVEKRTLSGREIPVISLEAGVVTEDAMEYAKARGYIFATDPTSAWASTIGGNIAENSGGKKCVMWGTAIDNIASFLIITQDSRYLRVVRRDHPYRKIEPEDVVIFDIFSVDDKNRSPEKPERSIELSGLEIRKKGLGKDITNKALNGLPGLQKEGGDGVIVSAEFVLYTPFQYAHTICLEFYGKDMDLASRAIVDILDMFRKTDECFLTALEHFDDKYIDAINYKKKANRKEKPKAVLLIDIESNDAQELGKYSSLVLTMVEKYNTSAFVAEDEKLREHFWKDRKNMSAIARHTNAFKLNEDVVIPIEKLPDFADYIEKFNLAHEIKNSQEIIRMVNTISENFFIGEFCEEENECNFLKSRMELFIREVTARQEKYNFFFQYFSKKGKPLPADLFPEIPEAVRNRKSSIFLLARDGYIQTDFFNEIKPHLEESFSGYDTIKDKFLREMEIIRARKIIIATHMHAGDGNIHVNIPVHSNDYAMMKEAEKTSAKVMKKTVDFGGVISGEHGIGLTKLKYIEADILDQYQKYKKESDPEDIFNPDKLNHDFNFDLIYTPSFNLLEMEAYILKSIDMEKLSNEISSCLRCSRCKTVCNTFYPEETMFYHPRNKILAVATVIEAVLFSIQTANRLDLGNFAKLTEISSHCTLCHRCEKPCPVDIDFAEVTLLMRQILAERGIQQSKPATRLTLFYLKKRNYYVVKLFRYALLKGAYSLQRIGYTLNRPVRKITGKILPYYASILQSRLPRAGEKTIREIFSLRDKNSVIAFSHPKREIIKSVFYFPGCGSERMFSEISLAAVGLLYYAGYRVVIPQEYLCCGYPLLANGKLKEAEIKVSENRMGFHKIAESIAYMNIQSVVVTCGTCHEMLKKQYRLDSIFPHAELMDVNEFLTMENIYRLPEKYEEQMIYHEPCHSPLKKYGQEKVFHHLYSQAPAETTFCCGEGGTLALSTPKISNSMRVRKTLSISELSQGKNVEVLTTCPSCVQGLSRITEGVRVNGKSLVVKNAEIFLGKKWKKKLVKDLKKGLHKIIL